MMDELPSFSKQEGLTLRALDHGGFLVAHPDIYTVKALYFAATTIDEAFEFMRKHLNPQENAGGE